MLLEVCCTDRDPFLVVDHRDETSGLRFGRWLGGHLHPAVLRLEKKTLALGHVETFVGEKQLWLDLGRIPILRTEGHAVPTFVAQLGEDHVLLSSVKTGIFGRADIEEGIVGANGDAEVAGNTSPHLEFVVDAAGCLLVPGVAV